jgi:uridine phosphorylase
LTAPTLHLRPAAEVAADALLPGDPGRALALAQLLLVKPAMSNHARGLWGYTGETPAGDQLTVQATGMGGPSTAIVVSELAELGTRRAVRVGTCGALDPSLRLGDLLVATAAIAADGASSRLGANGRVEPDLSLTKALEAEGADPIVAVSTDLFYEPDEEEPKRWREQGAGAVEMEAATVFALGAQLGLTTGCLLVVSDVFEEGQRRRIADEDLAEAAERMGRAAAAALAATR